MFFMAIIFSLHAQMLLIIPQEKRKKKKRKKKLKSIPRAFSRINTRFIPLKRKRAKKGNNLANHNKYISVELLFF